MLHTPTKNKRQPLWNIQPFTADVAACLGYMLTGT